MRGRRVCDILEEAAQFEGGVPLSRMIDLRHELTVLIKSELYGGGDKAEGRAALTARLRLDGFFFHTNPLGATAADLDGLKSAIILTTLGEQMDLLDQARDADGLSPRCYDRLCWAAALCLGKRTTEETATRSVRTALRTKTDGWPARLSDTAAEACSIRDRAGPRTH